MYNSDVEYNKNKMLFNVDKCKVMHIGNNNGKAKYEINDKLLKEVIEERDLGVIMRNDMKCNSQCIKAVKTANRVLGMIERTFTVRDKSIILQLYKSLVGPHLEYSMQSWRSHFRKDIDLLEGVQRIANKLITAIKDEIYEDRVRYVNLITLETRRLRGDVIEVFKMFEGFDDLDPNLFFELSQAMT